MPSAFRRSDATKSKHDGSDDQGGRKPISMMGLSGVKPWAGGIHLTSMGLRDLDAIAGGGQPLGTCFFLQEDRWAYDLAHCLVRYWCAEAISHDQDLLMPVFDEDKEDDNPQHEGAIFSSFSTTDLPTSKSSLLRSQITELLESLPRNLHWDRSDERQSRQQQQAGDPSSAPLQILEEGEEDEDAPDNTDEGLSIAWQYKTSVQKQRMSHQQQNAQLTKNEVFCSSYDLSGRLKEQLKDKGQHFAASDYIKTIPTDRQARYGEAAFQVFKSLVALLSARSDNKVIRLLLFRPDPSVMVHVLPLLLSHIRSKGLPVVILICLSEQPLESKSILQLQHSSDFVIATEGFASRKEYPPPPEFRHLQGLLFISKASTVTAATALEAGHFADLTISKRPASNIYGLKRDRRKLNIPLLHIPPEDYAAGGSSVGTGVRSGGGRPDTKPKSTGMGCSANLEGSALDF